MRKKVCSNMPLLPSTVASQCLWHKYMIKTDDETIFNSSLYVKGKYFMG